jgi:hypothetical protein
MPGPEAEAALLQALAKTSGSNQVGIINSLAVRRDAKPRPPWANCFPTPTPTSPAPPPWAWAASAGRRRSKRCNPPGATPPRARCMKRRVDGLLACANQLLTEGKDSDALKIFQRLYDTGKKRRRAAGRFSRRHSRLGKERHFAHGQGHRRQRRRQPGSRLASGRQMEGSGRHARRWPICCPRSKCPCKSHC